MTTQRVPAIAAVVLGLVSIGCFERTLRPVSPCTRSNVGETIAIENVDEVDLLFMIDNSGSMSEEQAQLTRELPRLVEILATGDQDDDGTQDFPPVRSLHIGVVTSDMGTGGFPVPTCDRGTFGTRFGDDGVLVTRGRTAITGCLATYPSVFEFTRGTTDPEQFARDVACVATTGTGGCGFEQQLEAVLKAVSPSSPQEWTVEGYEPPVFVEGTRGHALDANAGFLRPESALAVIVVTDEEDCSVSDPGVFDMASTQYPGDLNLRCWMYGSQVEHPIERYVLGEDGHSGLIGLRRNPNHLIFAGIVGVPVDAVGATYDEMLAHPDMQEILDPDAPATAPRLRPSCNTANGIAFPPRRIVRTAQALELAGASSTIQSICQSSYSAALDRIVGQLANVLGAVCLPRDLNADADGFVECEVFEILPERGATTSCEGLPGRTPAGTVVVGGVERARCAITQVGSAHDAPGWFYEAAETADASSDVGAICGADGQRIELTIEPITSSDIRLECLQTVMPSAGAPVAIGSFCAPQDASACAGGLAPDRETVLSCDAADRTCAVACGETADCTRAGLLGDVCDTRTWEQAIGADDPQLTPDARQRLLDALTAAGVDPGAPHGFCVNATCI